MTARAVAPPPQPPPPTKETRNGGGTSSAKQSAQVNTASTAGFTSSAEKVSPKSAPLPSLFPDVPEVSDSSPKLKVAVIGAGLAGLSTAVELMDQGYQVDVYDQRPHVGGKVASWRDKDGNHIEMGLHVFFGCYFNLFRLMAKCGALENLLLKDHAHTFVNDGGDVRLLDFRFSVGDFKVGAPFHGLKAFFTTPQLSLQDKAMNALALGTSPVVRAVIDPEGGMVDVRKLDDVSFEDWFKSHGACSDRRKARWHCQPALLHGMLGARSHLLLAISTVHGGVSMAPPSSCADLRLRIMACCAAI